jgi:glucose-1-phosphate thymidylyltransferase
MKAIIPAAGIGTRLRPHTYSVPKILLNVAGKPIICYIIDDLLKLNQVDKIIIIVGHLGDKVQSTLLSRYKNIAVEKFIFIEQTEMLGLGHAVNMAKEYALDDSLLIILGDTIFEFDYNTFVNLDVSALGVKDVDNPERFGIVEVKDKYISRMIEKPKPEDTDSHKAIAGIYLVKDSNKLFDAIDYLIKNNVRTKNEFQLTDALQHMVAKGEKFFPFEIQNWFDCGKPETLLSTNKYLLGNTPNNYSDKNFKNSIIVSPSFIGEDCVIENSIIGPYSTIASGCKIISSIIENSIVGEQSLIENSILNESIIGAEVIVKGDSKQLYIGDSTEIKL